MKKILFLISLSYSLFGQDTIQFRYFVTFSDKGDNNISDYQPEDLFSQKSLDRRQKQGIDIHYSDLPVFQNYIDSLENYDFKILNKSRWFNGVLCGSSQNDISILLDLNFVEKIDSFGYYLVDKSFKKASKFGEINDGHYGSAFNQIDMLQGQSLHDLNFQGQEINIAVLDAGFRNADQQDGLAHLYENNQIKGTWDYVQNESSVYEDNYHGMSVLSTMATYLENDFIGTSPKANYWLLRTEDSGSENLIEEYYWLFAAEFCDSVGVDIINSSLGYTDFDLGYQDHTYSDLDGYTTPITKAATLAARKGIIVCSSAGNSGNNSWYYISAPGDADSILTVGSVDQNRNISTFSSRGPSYDGRLKPTVSAQGGNTVILNSNNTISTSNGTSFSSPIIAGMTACLWQANYQKSAQEIISAITMSSHLNKNPNFEFGNGIPNFSLAHRLLSSENSDKPFLFVYPNPIIDKSLSYINSFENAKLFIYDIDGKIIYEELLDKKIGINRLSFPNIESGVYFIVLDSGTIIQKEKIVILD